MASHRRRDAAYSIRVHRRNVVSLLSSPSRTPPRRGKHAARRADGAAGRGGGRKRRPACNGADRGCNITPPERVQTSLWSGVTREPDKQTSGSDADMSQAATLAGAAPNSGDRGLPAPGGYREGFFRQAKAARVYAVGPPRGTFLCGGGLELPHDRLESNGIPS
jgi:hypothetical protein